MAFRLNISPELNTADQPEIQNALDQLIGMNINWEPPAGENFPEVLLSLGQENKLQYQVTYNRETVTQGAVELKSVDAGKNLGYRLFKVLR